MYKFTCYHCRTGMVISLPAKCPECEKVLTKKVTSKKTRSKKC